MLHARATLSLYLLAGGSSLDLIYHLLVPVPSAATSFYAFTYALTTLPFCAYSVLSNVLMKPLSANYRVRDFA